MKRSDGELLKSLDPFAKVTPYILDKRSSAQNFSKQVFDAAPIDAYILEKKKQGYKINYLHIFIAAYIRLVAERPQLNRFIMNSKVYQRNHISVAMVIKLSLRDEGAESTVRFEFTGRETIFQIVEMINQTIATTKEADTDTDKIIATILSMPGFAKKLLVKLLKGMDRYNLLPQSVIKASPFHTTFFFTYLKSINATYVYHHLYDLGTTSFFVALGKTEKIPVVENDQVVVKKSCTVGYTMDDRICDGVYLARSLKLLEKYLANPTLLEQ